METTITRHSTKITRLEGRVKAREDTNVTTTQKFSELDGKINKNEESFEEMMANELQAINAKIDKGMESVWYLLVPFRNMVRIISHGKY